MHKPLVAPRTALQAVAAVIAGTLTVALTSQVRIDLGFTPVPATLQVLGVLLVGMALGARIGAGSLVLYLALGAAGAPMFPGNNGGLVNILSGRDGLVAPTLGYLLAFPIGAYAAGWLWERRLSNSFPYAWICGLAGVAVIYAGGVAWELPQRVALLGPERGLALVLTQAVAPFIFLDGAKAAIVSALITGGHRSLRGITGSDGTLG